MRPAPIVTALLTSITILIWLQFERGQQLTRADQNPLDVIPVTDPRLYLPENLKRFRLNETEYCAPRLGSLSVYIPKTTEIPLGAQVVLDPDSLTNFNQPHWRNGKPNPEWSRGMTVGISPAKEGWGFPLIVKMDIGKPLEEVSDSDFSSIDDIAREIARNHETGAGADDRSRYVLVKFGAVIARLRWSSSGGLHLAFPVAERVTGSLSVSSAYIEQLESLFKVAHKFFRPCESIYHVPN